MNYSGKNILMAEDALYADAIIDISDNGGSIRVCDIEAHCNNSWHPLELLICIAFGINTYDVIHHCIYRLNYNQQTGKPINWILIYNAIKHDLKDYSEKRELELFKKYHIKYGIKQY